MNTLKSYFIRLILKSLFFVVCFSDTFQINRIHILSILYFIGLTTVYEVVNSFMERSLITSSILLFLYWLVLILFINIKLIIFFSDNLVTMSTPDLSLCFIMNFLKLISIFCISIILIKSIGDTECLKL